MNLDMVTNPHFDPSTQMWKWPPEFQNAGNALMWRDKKDYEERMKAIQYFTLFNFGLLDK